MFAQGTPSGTNYQHLFDLSNGGMGQVALAARKDGRFVRLYAVKRLLPALREDTSAREMFETDGILMTSVDTGWITDERPHPTKVRLAEEGFHAPLDLVDGAARVYDPIVRGEAGEDLFGVFLKDYAPGSW